MRHAVRWGLVLGAAVALENVVFAAAGWHTMYRMAFAFLVVAIAMNAVAVVMCLRRTAAESGWLGQVGNGALLGLVASVLVFLSGWLVTGVAFPDYFAEMAEGYRAAFVEMAMSPEEIERTVAGLAATSPVRSALEGVVGTALTSVVVAAVAGLWLRRRPGSAD